jgi:hypothetical protein
VISSLDKNAKLYIQRCQIWASVCFLLPVGSCCLPVTKTSAPPKLRWSANARWKWQFLLLEVLHSAERWIDVR